MCRNAKFGPWGPIDPKLGPWVPIRPSYISFNFGPFRHYEPTRSRSMARGWRLATSRRPPQENGSDRVRQSSLFMTLGYRLAYSRVYEYSEFSAFPVPQRDFIAFATGLCVMSFRKSLLRLQRVWYPLSDGPPSPPTVYMVTSISYIQLGL